MNFQIAQTLLRLLAYAALVFVETALDATLLLPASAVAFLVCLETADGFLSDIRGIGTSDTAETCTSSKNFLKSLSDITFFAEDFYDSFTCGLFFSGVDGAGSLVVELSF